MNKLLAIISFTFLVLACKNNNNDEVIPSGSDSTDSDNEGTSYNLCNIQNSSSDYEWTDAEITDSLGNTSSTFSRGENFIMSYNLNNNSSNDTLCYVFNTEAFPITYEIRNSSDSLISSDWSHTCVVVTGAVGSTTILPNSSRTYSIEYYPELEFDICADTLDAGNYTVKINSGSSYQGIQSQEFGITIEK